MTKRRASFVALLVAIALGGSLFIGSWAFGQTDKGIDRYRDQCKIEQSEDYDGRMNLCIWRKPASIE